MELNLKLLQFPKFLELRGPTFILECPICLDYEEVILRELEQVRIFVKWHHFREIRPNACWVLIITSQSIIQIIATFSYSST